MDLNFLEYSDFKCCTRVKPPPSLSLFDIEYVTSGPTEKDSKMRVK